MLHPNGTDYYRLHTILCYVVKLIMASEVLWSAKCEYVILLFRLK